VAFTRDKEAVRRGLESITPFGSTALHDALDKGARDIASHGEGRRAVVVLTDGVDTSSQKTADEVIERSRALDVPIYAVSVVSPLDDPSSPRFLGKKGAGEAAAAAETLSRYAALSGGTAFRVSDAPGLQRAAARIAGELKHQYRLGWDAPEGSPRFRRVVVLSTRKGIHVRTRSGYVPPSESSPVRPGRSPSPGRSDKEAIE
jgi:Ca-activated chloride channel family protein